MTKDQGRKAQRRSRRPTAPLDDDLAHLAEVLSEHSLDNNAHGWFGPPWRNGIWAINLARYAAQIVAGPQHNTNLEITELLDSTGTQPFMATHAYERAGQLYCELIQPKLDTDASRLLAAALRCFQIKIANSHGGGTVYNEILIPAFAPIEPALVEKYVLDYRCCDAIGTTNHLQGDSKDRLRRAFTIAWQRGLYFAAYALKGTG